MPTGKDTAEALASSALEGESDDMADNPEVEGE